MDTDRVNLISLDFFCNLNQAFTTTQQSFTCVKSTIETLKKMWSVSKGNNKDTRVFIATFEHI